MWCRLLHCISRFKVEAVDMVVTELKDQAFRREKDYPDYSNLERVLMACRVCSISKWDFSVSGYSPTCHSLIVGLPSNNLAKKGRHVKVTDLKLFRVHYDCVLVGEVIRNVNPPIHYMFAPLMILIEDDGGNAVTVCIYNYAEGMAGPALVRMLLKER
eukprot:GHVU01012587.1.p1 GENE.GHVU01012587.1~~GHVU01012587.1.p1  ORF type:complete len:158 (+),score=11.60 GHVU01012587.1:379-852(+)